MQDVKGDLLRQKKGIHNITLGEMFVPGLLWAVGGVRSVVLCDWNRVTPSPPSPQHTYLHQPPTTSTNFRLQTFYLHHPL